MNSVAPQRNFEDSDPKARDSGLLRYVSSVVDDPPLFNPRFQRLLDEFAARRSLEQLTLDTELRTAEAGDLLGASAAYLATLIEKGEMRGCACD